MFNKTRNILFSTLLVSVTACAGSGARYIPVVDGPVTEKFHTDLDSCRAVSASLQFNNGDVRTEAAAGALFGAVAGVLEDGTEGAIVGSALGAIAGGADRAWDVREERKAIVMKCLTNRGHNVVG